jgi:acetyl esterase
VSGPTDITARDLVIDGPYGDVPARLYRGSSSADVPAALVWVHGGGFVAGDLDMPEADWVGTELAACGIPVLSLDYRKAMGGVHYPVPSDDVLAGWAWAVEHSGELGVAAERLHLGGASAGGNLVAGVTKRLRDGAGRLPASVVLAYPVVHPGLPEDPGVDLAEVERLAGEFFFSAALTQQMTMNYAGEARLLTDPYAFPSNGELGGQPPVLVMNCEYDSLRASGAAYAGQLAQAGVEVREVTMPLSQHGVLNRPETVHGRRALHCIADWLRDRAAGTDG